jgi:hypothetical protein
MIIGIERCAALALCAALVASGPCALAPSSALAAEDAAWSIERLMASLREMKSDQARFVERKELSVLSRPIEFSGTLLYTAPDHLEKHTLRPRPESMILDGDSMIIERTAGGPRRTFSLREFPVLWAFVESIRSTLAGDLETLRSFYDATLSGDEKRWRLLLKPAVPKMREFVVEIRIEGAGNRISSISVVETGGDRSTMTISRDAS